MAFKGGSKGPNAAMPPKRPKMAHNRHIPRYNKKTKQLLFIKSLICITPFTASFWPIVKTVEHMSTARRRIPRLVQSG